MARPLFRLSLILLTVVVSSCSFMRKRDRDNNERSNEPVTLQVENRNWNDIVIYALVNGSRTRVGNVGATRSTTIRLPQSLMPSSSLLELVLDPLGSRTTFRTGG